MSDLITTVNAVIAEAEADRGEGLVSFYSTGTPRLIVVVACGHLEQRLTEILDNWEDRP